MDQHADGVGRPDGPAKDFPCYPRLPEGDAKYTGNEEGSKICMSTGGQHEASTRSVWLEVQSSDLKRSKAESRAFVT